ncbi:general substrate transporter [Lasiosphaeria hispida]|uniref:General substrate transporter n=1 Tax=Lasiosphaeria hispida TaxID=260671 RepID=A0AAJ0MA53_9PEZI|nr:general substrate transporter [Lasiosphaeria hispida]
MGIKAPKITTILALPETSLWANRRCLAICAIVAMANMQYGLDSACLAGIQAMPGFLKVFGYENPAVNGGYAIGRTFQQLIGSFLTLGAFMSSIFAGFFAQYLGRKPALWAACALTAIGAAIQIGTDSQSAVYVGRIVLGIGNGFLVTFSNIYNAEAAPAHLRGITVAFFSIAVNTGSIIGAAVNNATQKRLDKSSYQIPLGIQFLVPAMLTIGLFFVPESPRWLVNKGREAEGRKSFETLRGDSMAAEDLELEWVEMVKGIEEEKKLARSTGPLDMFRGNDLRRTLLCYAVIASQTGSGSWFVISYSTYFMIVSGVSVDDAFKYSIMKTGIGFIGVGMGMFLMRHVLGRRSMFTVGAFFQGMFMLSMALVATTSPGTVTLRNSIIAFTALYNFAYNAFVGATSYPVATELVSTRLRAWSVGTSISLGYFLAWLTGFCSPYFINPEALNWGAKYGYIWAGSNFICGIFFFIFLPELKGRTLEEIDELFERRIPAWKFKSTQTHIHEEALRVVKDRDDIRLQDSKDPVELVEDAKN